MKCVGERRGGGSIKYYTGIKVSNIVNDKACSSEDRHHNLKNEYDFKLKEGQEEKPIQNHL